MVRRSRRVAAVSVGSLVGDAPVGLLGSAADAGRDRHRLEPRSPGR